MQCVVFVHCSLFSRFETFGTSFLEKFHIFLLRNLSTSRPPRAIFGHFEWLFCTSHLACDPWCMSTNRCFRVSAVTEEDEGQPLSLQTAYYVTRLVDYNIVVNMKMTGWTKSIMEKFFASGYCGCAEKYLFMWQIHYSWRSYSCAHWYKAYKKGYKDFSHQCWSGSI